ncbi:hypothetical protein C5167_048047 [Papaver somniferum]|uniref:Uncharacterized protein n=1 Tax=Papaver somniferum TaxID=3469 RepID=A0A4Y7KL01_PAPSO|nr:hypothetical protein C5167_048047 [Papaver somniferum]
MVEMIRHFNQMFKGSSFLINGFQSTRLHHGNSMAPKNTKFTFELLRDSTLILQLIDMDVVSCKNVSLSLQVLLGITDSELGLLDKVEDVEYEKSTTMICLLVEELRV